MGKRSELEPAAIRLYADGMEIPQIAAELGVSENSLREWKKRAGKEWDEARANFRKGQVASFEDVGRRVQRAREIADRISVDARIQGKVGSVLNQSLQTMVYDVMEQMQTTGILDPETMTATIDQMKGLALTIQRMETAANQNLKREAEIRKQTIEAAVTEVKKKAHDGTFQFDPEAVEYIAGALYGLKI